MHKNYALPHVCHKAVQSREHQHTFISLSLSDIQQIKLDCSPTIRLNPLDIGESNYKSWETQTQQQDGGKPTPQCAGGAP